MTYRQSCVNDVTLYVYMKCHRRDWITDTVCMYMQCHCRATYWYKHWLWLQWETQMEMVVKVKGEVYICMCSLWFQQKFSVLLFWIVHVRVYRKGEEEGRRRGSIFPLPLPSSPFPLPKVYYCICIDSQNVLRLSDIWVSGFVFQCLGRKVSSDRIQLKFTQQELEPHNSQLWLFLLKSTCS